MNFIYQFYEQRVNIRQSLFCLICTIILSNSINSWSHNFYFYRILIPFSNLQSILTPVFSGVRVTWSQVLCVMFCRTFFVLLYFFFWPLCCLSFLDLRILILPLVSSSSFYGGIQLWCIIYCNHLCCSWSITKLLYIWAEIWLLTGFVAWSKEMNDISPLLGKFNKFVVQIFSSCMP